MIIGLTGGIASGKSTVVEIIKDAGYKVIDADQLVHDMQVKGGRLYQALLDCLAKEEDVFFMDIPLLFENDYQDWFDQIWLVAVSPQVQCQRLMKRNHLSAEEAGMRIASQMPLAEKLPYASLVIDNNGNIDDLKKKVKGAIKDLANLV